MRKYTMPAVSASGWPGFVEWPSTPFGAVGHRLEFGKQIVEERARPCLILGQVAEKHIHTSGSSDGVSVTTASRGTIRQL